MIDEDWVVGLHTWNKFSCFKNVKMIVFVNDTNLACFCDFLELAPKQLWTYVRSACVLLRQLSMFLSKQFKRKRFSRFTRNKSSKMNVINLKEKEFALHKWKLIHQITQTFLATRLSLWLGVLWAWRFSILYLWPLLFFWLKIWF